MTLMPGKLGMRRTASTTASSWNGWMNATMTCSSDDMRALLGRLPAAKPSVDGGQHEEREGCARDEPSNDDGGKGPLHLGARTCGQGHRHEAQRCDERCHQDRPHPEGASAPQHLL